MRRSEDWTSLISELVLCVAMQMHALDSNYSTPLAIHPACSPVQGNVGILNVMHENAMWTSMCSSGLGMVFCHVAQLTVPPCYMCMSCASI